MDLITLISWEKHPQVIVRRVLYFFLFYACIIGILLFIYLLSYLLAYLIIIFCIGAFLLVGYKFSKAISQQHKKVYNFRKNSIECIGKSYKPMAIIFNFLFNRKLNEKKDNEDMWDHEYSIKGKITTKMTRNDYFIPNWLFPFNLGKQQILFTISIIDTSQQSPTEVILEYIRKEDWEINKKDIAKLLEK